MQRPFFTLNSVRNQDYCGTGFISRACIKHAENLMSSAAQNKRRRCGVVLMKSLFKAPVKSTFHTSVEYLRDCQLCRFTSGVA